MKNLFSAIIFGIFLSLNIFGQVSAGGSFKLEQTALAGGGGNDGTGGNFKIEGTIGQAAAGTRSTVSPFGMQNGFWTSAPLIPTADEVTVGGQVLTKSGGIKNVLVTLNESNGTQHTTISSSLGYYRFTGITAGQTVVISVQAKRFDFSQPTQIVLLLDDTDGINFVADEK